MIFVVGGGGLSLNNALLHINAPSGSTIQLAKGSVTVATLNASKGHPNSDGVSVDWYYSVNSSNYGEWSISAFNSDAASTYATVTINSVKQYDVVLKYNLYVIKGGMLQGYRVDEASSAITVTENYNNTNSLRLYAATSSIVQQYVFLNPAHNFNLRPYNTLHCTFLFKQGNTSSGVARIGIGSNVQSLDNNLWPAFESISKDASNTQTITIDISQLTDSWFFKVAVGSSQSYTAELYLYNFWLD